jgi:hypothetical protein
LRVWRGPGCGPDFKQGSGRRLAGCLVCVVTAFGGAGMQSAYATTTTSGTSSQSTTQQPVATTTETGSPTSTETGTTTLRSGSTTSTAHTTSTTLAHASTTLVHTSTTVAHTSTTVAHTSTTVAHAGTPARPKSTTTTTRPAPRLPPGYWVVRADGTVENFGTASLGDLGNVKLNRPIVSAAATPDGRGYWLVASNGGVFCFGDATFHGSPGGLRLNSPIVGIAPTPDGGGYWLIAADGGIFNYGDARFFGSMGGRHLNKRIVGIAATPDGGGYWLVATDGGIFAFGDARFLGSTGSDRLNKPIVGMAATPGGDGYWLVASDGGIFAYGHAGFHGSTGSRKLPSAIVGIAVTPDGKGYWLVEKNGTLFSFGNAPDRGSATAKTAAKVVAMAVGPASSTSPTTGPSASTLPPSTTTTSVPPTTTTSTTTTTIPATTSTTEVLPEGPNHPYPSQVTGYDVSWPQCSPHGSGKVQSLPVGPAFGVVGVNNGKINGFDTCFTAEIAWAGINRSMYIIMEPAPGNNPVQETSGPDASCAKTSNACLGYDWGYNYAMADLGFVKAAGLSPKMWWVDVEIGEQWPTTSADKPVNAAIIQGALDAIKDAGHIGGVYSTWFQWGEITGSYVPPGSPPLWVPGADTLTGGDFSAQSFCQRALSPGDPSTIASASIGFAGGVPWLVQYGYDGATAPEGVDPDYSCGLVN